MNTCKSEWAARGADMAREDWECTARRAGSAHAARAAEPSAEALAVGLTCSAYAGEFLALTGPERASVVQWVLTGYRSARKELNG